MHYDIYKEPKRKRKKQQVPKLDWDWNWVRPIPDNKDLLEVKAPCGGEFIVWGYQHDYRWIFFGKNDTIITSHEVSRTNGGKSDGLFIRKRNAQTSAQTWYARQEFMKRDI